MKLCYIYRENKISVGDLSYVGCQLPNTEYRIPSASRALVTAMVCIQIVLKKCVANAGSSYIRLLEKVPVRDA